MRLSARPIRRNLDLSACFTKADVQQMPDLILEIKSRYGSIFVQNYILCTYLTKMAGTVDDEEDNDWGEESIQRLLSVSRPSRPVY